MRKPGANRHVDPAGAVGVAKAFGPLSAEAQGVVLRLCHSDVAAATHAVAEILLDDALVTGRVAQAGGLRTPDFVRAVEASIREAASAYAAAGGVLVAKDFTSLQALVDAMTMRWNASFRSEVTTNVDVADGVAPEEIRERLALVARRAHELLMKDAVRTTRGMDPVIAIPEDRLEGLCRRLASEMFRVMQNPNEYVHELLHGAR